MAALPSLPPSLPPSIPPLWTGTSCLAQRAVLPMFVYETFAVAAATQSSFDGCLQLLRVELLLFSAQVDGGGGGRHVT